MDRSLAASIEDMACSASGLDQKVALITGGARGIGASVSTYLAEKGAAVIVADIDGETARRTAEKIVSTGGRAASFDVDISDRMSVENMFRQAEHEFHAIDILVNNAGLLGDIPIPDLQEHEWDRVMNVNLKGTFLCSQCALQKMETHRAGKIVNIASLAGQIGGMKAGPDYTASKAGIIGLTKSFARHAAPLGINVNVICPGFIETDMTAGRDDPESVPLLRLGRPLDVAKAVYFLSSDLSDYITGATIDINGGLSMR